MLAEHDNYGFRLIQTSSFLAMSLLAGEEKASEATAQNQRDTPLDRPSAVFLHAKATDGELDVKPNPRHRLNLQRIMDAAATLRNPCGDYI
jgi:hypothetical protein